MDETVRESFMREHNAVKNDFNPINHGICECEKLAHENR